MKQLLASRSLIRSFIVVALLCLTAGCTPNGDADQPHPTPIPQPPDDRPVKEETACDMLIGLKKGELIAPTDAVRRGHSFLVRSFASFMGTTAPDETRRFIGVKGTLFPALNSLDSSSAVYTAVCTDHPMNEPNGSIIVRTVIPRPEMRIFNTNEYQSFQALAPESIWGDGDGSLDGSLVPSLEWNLGLGWRLTMTASRESFRSDLFQLKRFFDRSGTGGKSSLETYAGATRDSFVIVYTVDTHVNGKPVRVRNELEYVAL